MPNLQKFFWVALVVTILAWVGVGIYYFSTIYSPRTPVTLPPQATILPTVQPTKPAVSESLGETHFIVGYFEDWKEINDSEDRYLFLIDSETKETLPKIRVGFEITTLYVVEGKGDITDFVMEKDKEEYNLLLTLKFFTYHEIDQLVKKGDPIKIFFKRKLEREENLKDESGNLLAQWLLIKGEKTEIEQIIGRETPKS